MYVVLLAEVNGVIQKAWDALEQTEKEAYITKVCRAVTVGSSVVSSVLSSVVRMVTALLPSN